MRILFLPATLALAAIPALAQDTLRPTPVPRVERRVFVLRGDDQARAAIGVGTSSGVSARDTLGLLVTNVTPGGPADKAGIDEGDRLQAINGTSLRLSRSDIDAPEMNGIMQRRLVRELGKVKPGDDVDLSVYSDGKTRTVKLKTVASDSLFGRMRIGVERADEDRASLGLAVGATGSRRDTLGVFIMAVNDSGPAAKAGIEEGSRIAAINGVDLRVAGADAGDEMVAGAKARRLQREVSKLKPGDAVELRVYTNGRFRTVKTKAVRAADLPGHSRTIFFGGDRIALPRMPEMPEMPMLPRMPRMPRMELDFDGPALRQQIERSLDRALEGVNQARHAVRITTRS